MYASLAVPESPCTLKQMHLTSPCMALQVLLRSQPRTVTSLQAKRFRFRTGRGTCPPAVVVDGVRRPQCLRFPRHEMELCFVQAFRGVMEPGVAGCMAALTPRDVVLFNSGLHFGHTEADAYRASVAELTKVLARLSTARGGRSRMPISIWRETSAQHFPGGGEFRRKAAVSASFRCQQAPLTALNASNWRNAMAETALGGQLPILRVWNVSAAAPQAHTHVRVKASQTAATSAAVRTPCTLSGRSYWPTSWACCCQAGNAMWRPAGEPSVPGGKYARGKKYRI